MSLKGQVWRPSGATLFTLVSGVLSAGVVWLLGKHYGLSPAQMGLVWLGVQALLTAVMAGYRLYQ
ncbi:hypothetical protein CSO34_004729 [Salmonella enterica subsp. diarizonae]|nr:hypothetical protein [Salmonella enterica subsp. diarizonae]